MLSRGTACFLKPNIPLRETECFGYLFYSLNLLGQPRKYGCHKKNAPKTIKGVLRSSEVLKLLSSSSSYFPISSSSWADVKFLELMSSFPDIFSFLFVLGFPQTGYIFVIFFVRLLILLNQYSYYEKSVIFFSPYFEPIYTP